MKMLKAKDNASKDKPDKLFSVLTEKFSSWTVFFKETLHISPLGPLHYDIVIIFIPEGRVERSDEARLWILQNSFFKH